VITSTMPLALPIRSVAKMTFTYSSKTEASTSRTSIKGRLASSSAAAEASTGKPGADQKHAINVIRLDYIRDETAVQNDAFDAGAPGQVDHPTERVELHPAKFGPATEPLFDFTERCGMNAMRQATMVIEGRDHR
jgi:hypothetical protein